MMVSLDGFFEGPKHDLSWHNVDAEFNEFAIKQLDEADTLIFGRRTYELMAGYWPTKAAQEDDPGVAERMNNFPKIVFSKTLKNAGETEVWKNIRLIKNNAVEELIKLKKQPGKAMAVLGSSTLCVSLIPTGIIDELRIMVNPVVIGKGTALFNGIKGMLKLKRIKTRSFKNGNIVLYYQPVKK